VKKGSSVTAFKVEGQIPFDKTNKQSTHPDFNQEMILSLSIIRIHLIQINRLARNASAKGHFHLAGRGRAKYESLRAANYFGFLPSVQGRGNAFSVVVGGTRQDSATD
jgi:hypothetical protein